MGPGLHRFDCCCAVLSSMPQSHGISIQKWACLMLMLACIHKLASIKSSQIWASLWWWQTITVLIISYAVKIWSQQNATRNACAERNLAERIRNQNQLNCTDPWEQVPWPRHGVRLPSHAISTGGQLLTVLLPLCFSFLNDLVDQMNTFKIAAESVQNACACMLIDGCHSKQSKWWLEWSFKLLHLATCSLIWWSFPQSRGFVPHWWTELKLPHVVRSADCFSPCAAAEAACTADLDWWSRSIDSYLAIAYRLEAYALSSVMGWKLMYRKSKLWQQSSSVRFISCQRSQSSRQPCSYWCHHQWWHWLLRMTIQLQLIKSLSTWCYWISWRMAISALLLCAWSFETLQ